MLTLALDKFKCATFSLLEKPSSPILLWWKLWSLALCQCPESQPQFSKPWIGWLTAWLCDEVGGLDRSHWRSQAQGWRLFCSSARLLESQVNLIVRQPWGEEQRTQVRMSPAPTLQQSLPLQGSPDGHRAPCIQARCLLDFGFLGTSLSCNLTLSDRILASTLLPNVAHSISLIYPWVYCCFWSRSILQFSILPPKTDTINCKCDSF